MVIGIALVVIVVAVILLKNKSKKPSDSVQKTENKPDVINPGDSRAETVIIVKNGKEMKGTVIYMAEGMQVFDGDGNIVVNTTDTICNSLGYVETDGKTSGVIENAAIKKSRIWVAVVFPKWTPELAEWVVPAPPNINVEDGKISYSYNGQNTFVMGGILYWGLY